jgi:hypothetical protein
MKKIPEKIHRYLVFGNWLCEQSISSDDVERIQNLLRINSSVDEQISFYTKFHEDYSTVDKNMSLNVKQAKRERKHIKDEEISEETSLKNDCDNQDPKRQKREFEDNSDYLWDMDDDFYITMKEMV